MPSTSPSLDVMLPDGTCGLRITTHPGYIEAVLLTDLDRASADLIRDSLEAALIEATPPRLVLDLAAASFVDSAGLGALVALYRRLLTRAGAQAVMLLIGPGRSAIELLELTQLVRYLPWYADRAQAEAAHAWMRITPD